MNTIDSKLLDSLNLTQAAPQKKDTLGQQDFLKLMTTQLNSQDPLKPMDGGQFFTQIAQFSSVAGIQDLQSSFQQVATAMYSSQALQASAMVGRSVMVPGAVFDLHPGVPVGAAAQLPAAATDLVVGVFDKAGQLVRRMDLGAQAAGDLAFSWDGKTDSGANAPAGTYQVKAEAQIDGATVALNTLLSAKVDSVSLGTSGQGIKLNLAGIGAIDLSAVKQVM